MRELGDPSTVVEYEDHAGWTPDDRLLAANQMAHKASMEPRMRHFAASILEGRPSFGKSHYCGNVPKQAGRCIARWIRQNIRYYQETPGVEVLQGPVTTLATRTGDCDDLAILFATLMRSVGLPAFVVGVGKVGQPGDYHHAVAYDAGSNKHWELSCDHRYGGTGSRSEIFTPRAGSVMVVFEPMSRRKGQFIAGGYRFQAPRNEEKESMFHGQAYIHHDSRVPLPQLPDNPQSTFMGPEQKGAGPAASSPIEQSAESSGWDKFMQFWREGLTPTAEMVLTSPAVAGPGGEVPAITPQDQAYYSYAQDSGTNYVPWVIGGVLVVLAGTAIYAFRDR